MERVHCARLLKYDDSLHDSDVPQDMLDLADQTETRYEVVAEIIDISEAKDGLFFQVKWNDLPNKRDYTWQPVKELYADIPDTVTAFLASSKKRKLVNQAKLQLGIST